MMIFAVKDTLIGFGAPFTAQSEAVAVRMFAGSAQAESPNVVNTYPENKELYKLGTYDEQTGTIMSEIAFLGRAIDYVIKGESK